MASSAVQTSGAVRESADGLVSVSCIGPPPVGLRSVASRCTSAGTSTISATEPSPRIAALESPGTSPIRSPSDLMTTSCSPSRRSTARPIWRSPTLTATTRMSRAFAGTSDSHANRWVSVRSAAPAHGAGSPPAAGAAGYQSPGTRSVSVTDDSGQGVDATADAHQQRLDDRQGQRQAQEEAATLAHA